MKRKFFLFALLLPILLLFCTVNGAAQEDTPYQFRFEQEPEEAADSAYEEYMQKLPSDIRQQVEGAGDAQSAVQQYSVSYFLSLIKDALGNALLPGVKNLSVLLGMVILASVFRMLSTTVKNSSLETIFSLCCLLCMALTLYEVQKAIFATVQALLDMLSETMLMIVPVMEAVYISSGNVTSAAVSGTGINLMITFIQTLYADVLAPCVSVCFLLSITAAVSGNRGVSFMAGALRGIVTGVLVLIMTLMSFVLSMQNGIASAADTFAAKTIKFALGSYLPIVGGTVADSFSMVSGSIGVIKQLSGAAGIVVIIIVLLPPLASLLVNRLALGVSGAMAGVLGCDREQTLLKETGSLCTLLLAITVAAAVMYIFALSLFCKASLAYS